jgi:hypothetical protein
MPRKRRPALAPMPYGVPFTRAIIDRLGLPQAKETRRKILERVGEEPVREIGHGGHGVVYALPSGRALKLTSDWSEMDAMAILRGVQHPNLVGVRDVFAASADGAAIGVVVRDLIEVPLEDFDPTAAEALDQAAEESEAVYHQTLRTGVGQETALRTAMNDLYGRLLQAADVSPLLLGIAEGIDGLANLGLFGINFHGRNVGVSDIATSPRAVIFDFGRFAQRDVPFALVGARSRRTPELRGRLPREATLHMFRDLDWGQGRPGELVAVLPDEWAQSRPVVEGWRGPRMESEDFVRTRLEPYDCQNLVTDIGGYWDCLRGTVIGG